MLDQFTQEYKQVMLEAENRAKRLGYKEIFPEDVFFQVVKFPGTPLAELFVTYGISESLLLDVFSRPPFEISPENREGEYVGISLRLREVIVLSVKIAKNFSKNQAGIEDFLLALYESQEEQWFQGFLDFIGVAQKEFHQEIVHFNTMISDSFARKGETGNIFGPIEEIMQMIENRFGNAAEKEEDTTPFSENPPQEKKDSTTPALDFFGTDLTQEVRQGKIDPVIGRNTEIERLISIINRKTKNNPVLVGDPGVGKTAVVEGLARRIAEGNVPFAMQGKRIISLDLSAMIAGTKYRGEFENRIKMVIEEASKLENEVILFIDEIHTIIGAGSGEGTLDAANILKPAMARGKISLIGATTLTEYQKYIEKDSALERRFQKIDVDEPINAVAVEIILGLRQSFEDFHNLIITEDAILEAVELSSRYVTDRFLPDKAIDLLDEACSAKSMTYNIACETTEIKEKIQVLQKEMNDMLMAQQYQKALARRKEIDALNSEIEKHKKKKSIPRKNRLKITNEDIQRVVHQMTGIPLKKLQKEDIARLKSLEGTLNNRILGQKEAIAAIVSSLKRSRLGISNENRPIGSFLFLGSTGVGKTELVKVLAEEFYADPKSLIKIDMSEFQDKASASKLIGTTAGYVGYDDGGMLTDRVRNKPYSVVLFDEIEKGNFDVYNLLLQILEDGMLTDGKGRLINFKNTIIVMTSNIGSHEFNEKAAQIGFSISKNEEERVIADFDAIRDKILGQLSDFFAPEFLNRIDKTLVFRPLDKKVIRNIIIMQLDELRDRLERIGIKFSYDSKAVNWILKTTYNPEYGARPVRRCIQDKIEDAIADHIILAPRKRTVQLSANTKTLAFTFDL